MSKMFLILVSTKGKLVPKVFHVLAHNPADALIRLWTTEPELAGVEVVQVLIMTEPQDETVGSSPVELKRANA